MANRTERFDVLTADEGSLWEWAVKRAGVENAATYIRDETPKAARARQTERGESQAPEPERDTDLARAELKGARDALTRYADSLGPAINARDVAERMSVLAFRDREYPAPKPAECRLSDGSVVTRARRYGAWRWIRAYPDGCPTPLPRCVETSDWFRVVNATDTGADFDALKAFAAASAEGR